MLKILLQHYLAANGLLRAKLDAILKMTSTTN